MKPTDLWNVEIKGKKLVITMDIETMFIGCPIMADFKITDKKLFLKELVNTLLIEEEDGTTSIHKMLDEAISITIDNGAEGIEAE